MPNRKGLLRCGRGAEENALHWLAELVVLLAVGVILGILPFWKISRAGYPGIMGLAMLVPFLNIIMLFYLGFGMARVARIGDTTKAD